MKVTEHNLTEWKLSKEEIDALIVLSKNKLNQCDDKVCELFYGLIAGKLLIMKHDK
jgi:hypothetical protein